MKKIGIAGAGGLGSNLVSIIHDYGYNREQWNTKETEIDLYDDDRVDLDNLLHQRFSFEDIGKKKVVVLSNQYVVNPIDRFMTEEDFGKYDVIFSCVDEGSFRKKLFDYAYEHKDNLWVCDGRCSSRSFGVFNSSCPKQSIEGYYEFKDLERRGCLLPHDKQNKKSHTTPIIVAAMMVQVFLNHLRAEDTTQAIVMHL